MPTPPPPPEPTPLTLAGGYPETTLTGARGDPLYWSRSYAVHYNGGVIRIQALPSLGGGDSGFQEALPAEEVLIWEMSELVTQQHQDAATFSAPTSDGRQAWLTVHRDGNIIGGGYHRTESTSYLRLGNPAQDAGPAAIEDRDFHCESSAPLGYPALPAPHGVRVRHDRTTYPWTSMSVQGSTVGLRTDPDGLIRTSSSIGYRIVDLDGDAVNVTLGAAYYDGLTTYTLRNGSLEAIQHSSHFVVTSCRP